MGKVLQGPFTLVKRYTHATTVRFLGCFRNEDIHPTKMPTKCRFCVKGSCNHGQESEDCSEVDHNDRS